jgi:hypothetical protein
MPANPSADPPSRREVEEELIAKWRAQAAELQATQMNWMSCDQWNRISQSVMIHLEHAKELEAILSAAGAPAAVPQDACCLAHSQAAGLAWGSRRLHIAEGPRR